MSKMGWLLWDLTSVFIYFAYFVIPPLLHTYQVDQERSHFILLLSVCTLSYLCYHVL